MEEIDEATHKRRRFGDMNARIQEKIALKTHSSPCTNALNIPATRNKAQSYTPHCINISIQTHPWAPTLIQNWRPYFCVFGYVDMQKSNRPGLEKAKICNV